MSEMTPEYQQFLKRGRELTNKPKHIAIEDMTLEQCLDAEAKFLAWYPVTLSDEKDVKKHIYENYLKPRIAALQREKEVGEAFGVF